uniref:Uncharacterized protein n=1 Tax=Globodera rostochiensis TaxID=31243 RepID=A0A914HQG8_GLORO
MVYSLTMNDSRVIRGKKFNCSFVWLLERYKLSDKYAINETIKVKSPGDAKFEKFGCNQRIIAYDMGIVTKNKEWVNEINSICNLEWRIFDFTQMAEGRVQDLESRAWKIFIIAVI